MTTKKIVKVVGVEVFAGWNTLEDVSKLFSDEDIVEMCVRYQAAQKHAVAYRERAKVKGRLLKERLAELEAQVAAGSTAGGLGASEDENFTDTEHEDEDENFTDLG